jgi:hypothetical protein
MGIRAYERRYPHFRYRSAQIARGSRARVDDSLTTTKRPVPVTRPPIPNEMLTINEGY